MSKYKLYPDGLYYSPKGFSDEEATPSKICSRFEVIAQIRNASDKGGWGKRVLIQAPDGSFNQVDILMKECQGYGNSLIGILADNGLQYTDHHARKHITDYFNACNPSKIIGLTDKIGWHGNAYVLPDEIIGYQSGDIEFSGNAGKFQVAGSLTDWQENVGRYCAGNSLLMFLTAFAFTGRLLKLLDIEGGGFHIYGSSSKGKTTQVEVAGSVCGGSENNGFQIQWRITDNALENKASRHNDNLLILDEISEAMPDDVYKVAYMLVNGQGKERMTKDAQLRDTNTWKVNFLSTGEMPIAEKIAESGKRKVKAGQEVRMVDLPVSINGTGNTYENLHGFKLEGEFSERLKTNSRKYYGAPLRVFLKALCGESQIDMNRNLSEIKAMMKSFIKKHCSAGISGQVYRVAARFALIAAAGAFACRHAILPWSSADAESVAAKWFNIWLNERGTLGSREIETAINNLQEHWTLNWRTKYADLYAARNGSLAWDISGYKERDSKIGKMICYMLSNTFSELIKGCDRRDALAELAKRGMLHQNSKGHPTDTVSIAGNNVRVTTLLFPDPENNNTVEPNHATDQDKQIDLDF